MNVCEYRLIYSLVPTGFHQVSIMKKGRGGVKVREAPTHSFEISELSHAARVTKNRHNRKVCSQEK